MKNKLIIALIFVFLLAFADTEYTAQPRAYTFTESELSELRQQLRDGETEKALETLNGRLTGTAITFIINPRTGKYHVKSCRTMPDIMYPIAFTGSRYELDQSGFKACKHCIE